MRSQLVVALLASVLAFSFAPGDADAKRNRSKSKSLNVDSEFGLGLMFGAPTGLSGKYYLGGDTAIDFGLATYYRYRYDNAIHLHADFLWHPIVLANTGAFQLPIHFGVGGRLLDHSNNGYFDNSDTHLGVRVPLGLTMYFNDVPLDIFFEIAYVLDLIRHDGHGYSDFNSALGIRYYF